MRSRHLERGVGSAATFLAAASQRTRRIALGNGVIQLGYEGVFRLAEDLATVDALSHGRLQIGVSAGPPPYGKLIGDSLFADAAAQDFSHARALQLRETLAGGYFGDEGSFVLSPVGNQRPRLHPHSPTLRSRLWYGGGSLRSAQWASRQGFHLLIGNLNQGEESDDFFVTQAKQLDVYLHGWGAKTPPRVALGRVIVPTDSADESSRRRYAAFAESRHARTLAPQGERRILFTRDLVGSSDQILETLRRDPILPEVSELRLELPYDLEPQQYVQILSDFVEKIAPQLGWRHPDGPLAWDRTG